MNLLDYDKTYNYIRTNMKELGAIEELYLFDIIYIFKQFSLYIILLEIYNQDDDYILNIFIPFLKFYLNKIPNYEQKENYVLSWKICRFICYKFDIFINNEYLFILLKTHIFNNDPKKVKIIYNFIIESLKSKDYEDDYEKTFILIKSLIDSNFLDYYIVKNSIQELNNFLFFIKSKNGKKNIHDCNYRKYIGGYKKYVVDIENSITYLNRYINSLRYVWIELVIRVVLNNK